MNPSELKQQQPNIHNPLSVMQPGEHVICEIKRHPIGMFGTYIVCGALILALAILTFIAGPAVFSGSQGQSMAIGGVFFLVISALLVTFVYIVNKVYWGNSWVVTSDSITQITQTSLFNKQSSQLSLGNLEDVTAEQRGMLPHLLNYGMVRAETAGEHSKFVFVFCPNPDYYAKKILAAREEFEQQRRADRAGGQQRPNSPAETYQHPQLQPQPQHQPPVEVPGVQPSQAYQQSSPPIFPDQPPSSVPAEPVNYPYKPPGFSQ